MHLFSVYEFDVILLICYGASANLKLLKLLCGEEPKVFPVGDGTDRYKVKTSFLNIYNNNSVHVIICPSHQLKNMIAALYSSRDFGTKYFELENANFGWTHIVDMHKRELTILAGHILSTCIKGISQELKWMVGWCDGPG